MEGQQGVTQQGIEGQQKIGENQFQIGRDAEKYNLGTKKDQYNTQMQAWAAGKAADAMAASAPQRKQGGIGGALGK